MPGVSEVINVFYSSTDDSGEFDRYSSFSKTCSRLEKTHEVSIHKIFWKDNIPGGLADASGQDKIDNEVRGRFDIYYGCLGTRFGKGTVKEFRDAVQSHIAIGKPKEILFAFDETPVNPYEVPTQFSQIKTFRRDIQSNKKYGKAVLYFTFATQEEYEDRLMRDLSAAIKKVKSRVRGGVPRVGRKRGP